MVTVSDDSTISWHAAVRAAGSVQGMWPHHLDLWLDRWTRSQHLATLGALEAIQPTRSPPRDDLW